jgi:hypothetical protein
MNLAELEAAFLEFKDQVPTLEGLMTNTAIQSWNGYTDITTNTRYTLMIAPIPIRILSVAVSFEYWTIAGSDTSYWTGIIEHGTQAGGFPDMATRTTQLTGANANNGITQRTPWTWDAAEWGTTDLSAGELLTVNWYATGTPAPEPLHFPALYTIRYREL